MKQLALGLAIIFAGSIFFTSCSSDNTVMSQFSKRKYMKKFRKSKVTQKESINDYRYAEAVAETENKTATLDNIILEEIVANDNSEMVIIETKNEVSTEYSDLTDVVINLDNSSWNAYDRKVDMHEVMGGHIAKENKNSILNKNNAQVDDVVLIILGIILPPLAVYLYEDSITNNFWLDLILTLCFWLPGVIYALLVMFAGVSI